MQHIGSFRCGCPSRQGVVRVSGPCTPTLAGVARPSSHCTTSSSTIAACRQRLLLTCASTHDAETSNEGLAKDQTQTKEQPPAPDPPPAQQPLFIRLLSRLPVPAWLGTFFQALRRKDGRAIQLARAVLIGAIFVGVAVSRQFMDAKTAVRTREVLYSDFVTLIETGRVRAARLESGTGRMYFDVRPPTAETAAETGTTTTAAAAEGAQAAEASTAEQEAAAQTAAQAASTATLPQRFQKQYVVKLADKNDFLLSAKVLAAGIEFGVLKQSYTAVLANVFMTTLALWIPLLPVFFLLRRIMEERSSTKKKKPDNKSTSVPITFKDVAGVDSAKEELMEVVTVMRSVKNAYTKLNVKIPSGVLLCGPPGTGKTLLAKAVAGEAGIPFFAFSASEFVELFVGRGAARIREVFAEARKSAPCVVFVDELDAVGARRGMGYNDERDQTLNQLLTELDGFEGRQGILFLAATNRMEILDPALLRPGRINRKVNVPLPDELGRRDILSVHLRTTPMAPGEDKMDACERLARVTQGFSGAELANVVNEGTLLAARKEMEVVSMRELLEGVQRTRFGVNGAGGGSGIASGMQKWLLDLATASDSNRKVKNATA